MRLHMPCDDRLGLVRDLAGVLVERGISIIAIEMDNGAVYLECQSVSEADERELILAFRRVRGIHSVALVPAMPFKERAEQLQAVLASVRDGILAVNAAGVLKQCNTAAARILQLSAEAIDQALPQALTDSRRFLSEGRPGQGKNFLPGRCTVRHPGAKLFLCR